MIWLTWRQFRASAFVAAVALGAVAIALGLTNTHSTTGAAGFLSHDHLLKFLSTALVGIPALIGAFWGAPLVARELETGTWRLAWTQSITRGRWLATKIGLIGLASVAATGLFSWMLTAWSSHSTNLGRFGTAMFSERGVAPMGYAAFGLAVGVAAGTVLRRTVPAMATTLVVFLVTRIVVQTWVRPHFATPLKVSHALSIQNGAPVGVQAGGWGVSDNIVNSVGHVVNRIACQGSGPQGALPNNAVSRACLAHYREVVTYQPASRYWAFQWDETALFAGVALILAGLCFWWLRHRLT